MGHEANIRHYFALIERSRTKHLGVNQQTLLDMGVYVAENQAAICAALDSIPILEAKLKALSSDAYMAGEMLAGIGLAGFNDTPWVRRKLRAVGRQLQRDAGSNLGGSEGQNESHDRADREPEANRLGHADKDLESGGVADRPRMDDAGKGGRPLVAKGPVQAGSFHALAEACQADEGSGIKETTSLKSWRGPGSGGSPPGGE
jgi:hypothetical protein